MILTLIYYTIITKLSTFDQLQYIYYHTAEMNITINEAQFSLEFLALNTGRNVYTKDMNTGSGFVDTLMLLSIMTTEIMIGIMIALYFLDAAHFLATNGISKAPGHQTTSMLDSSTPWRFSSSIAPDSNFPPINSLNLEIIIQNFSLFVVKLPCIMFVIIFRTFVTIATGISVITFALVTFVIAKNTIWVKFIIATTTAASS